MYKFIDRRRGLKNNEKKSLKIANPFLENKYIILKNIWKSDENVNQH
jgi:hypothetical protein